MTAPTVRVGRRGEARWRRGHPWIYRSDVVEADAEAGAIVRVVGPRGRLLGRAFHSDRSEIVLRRLTQGDVPVDHGFWRDRIAAAVAFRERLSIDGTAYRLVHGEADGLPSVVVDRYDDVLVVQWLSQGADRNGAAIVEALREVLAPRGVLLRGDAPVRGLEGLEASVEVLDGEVPERLVVREGKRELVVEPRTDQKTGLFLDQRENRLAARGRARGRVLDAFAYTGGFALQLADVADEVVCLESSEPAVARIEENAERNGLRGRIVARRANAFDALREAERAGERFDVVLLDPPPFARSKSAVDRALAATKELEIRAFRLLGPGGVLVTSSCSHHVTAARFLEAARAAAADAGASVRVVERRGQSADHPVLLEVPETGYLECLVLERLG